jgi:hypothetical protein
VKRADALRAIEHAGATDDKPTATRLFIENRISRAAFDEAWRRGKALAAFVAARDAAK